MSSVYKFLTVKFAKHLSYPQKSNHKMLSTSLRNFHIIPKQILSQRCLAKNSNRILSRTNRCRNYSHGNNNNSNNNGMNYWLNRVKSGHITKSEVQRLIINQDHVNQRLRDLQEHNRAIISITTDPFANQYPSPNVPNTLSSNVVNAASVTNLNLGSKSNPVYMKKQTSFKEFIFSLFPFVFIFWMLGGFDMVRNRKQGGMGGMFGGNNFSEWDEEDWEDDDDEDEDDEMEDSSRNPNPNPKRSKEAEELDRRTRFFRRLGINVTNPEPKTDKKKKTDEAPQTSTLKAKKKKRKRVRFKDVCGNEEAKIDLSDLVDYLKNPDKYQAMGCKLPKGVLMAGAPGTGKTLLARALAGEAGVPFLATNGASFDEIFVGVGVMRVRKLFERAKERSPCIVFIDEIDAIANTRMQMGTAHSSDSLNALLSEMDGFEQNSGVIVIAATNMPDRLDSALIRPGRFDRKVHLSLPDKKARRDIVRLYLAGRQDSSVDIALLVSDVSGFSGAELESMVNLASIDAVKHGRTKVSMRHLIEAKEMISMGRARRTLELPLATKTCTAYHESGHAIASLYTKGSKPIYKATILPRGQALGFVASSNSDEFMTTKQALLAQLDVCMAGRAAEEIYNGSKHVTTGASSDFNQATKIATAMVCQYGMSAKIGKVFYKFQDIPNLSPELQNNINFEVRRLLDDSFYRAQTVLNEHRDDLELLANELLSKETLSGDEIRELLNWDESQQKEPKDFILETKQKQQDTENEKIRSQTSKGKGKRKKTILLPKPRNPAITEAFAKPGMLNPETELLNPVDVEKL